MSALENIDLNYLCGVIAGLSGIPVRIFDGEEQVFYSSVADLPKDPMEVYRREIFSLGQNVGYYTTPQFQYYGVVRFRELRIVMGPTRQVSVSDAELR